MSHQPGYPSIAPAPFTVNHSQQLVGSESSRFEPSQRKNTSTECVKDDKDDKRRKIAVKWKIEMLEGEQQLLDDLLAAIRASNALQLDSLVNLIRSHVTKNELRSHIINTFNGSPKALESPIQPVSYRRRRMLGRIQDLVNPIISVPAQPWTTVTDDDDLVSHLMSLWLVWAHPWWQWIDKETFIEAMKAGDLRSPICAPYLVNIILADACLLDTLSEDDDSPNSWLREQFYNEAKKGIEAEESRVSFTLLAALGVQWTYLNTNGQDKQGNPIMYKQIYLAKDVEKWRSRIEQSPQMTPKVLADLDRNLSRLSWTLFALSSLTLINLEKSQPVEPPKRPKPMVDHEAVGQRDTWQPYPQPSQPFVFHSECHYHAFLSLAEKVMRDEALFISKGNSESLVDRFYEIFQELEQWPRNLPDCMSRGPKATPHVLALHALHQWIMVILSKQIAASDGGKADKPTIASTPQSTEHQYWQDRCINSAIEISKILERHRIDWGNDHFPVIIMRPMSIAPFALLEDLSKRPDSQQALVELCIAMSAASRRFKVGKGILGTIRTTAEKEHAQLPEQCQQLIEVMTKATTDSKLSAQGQLPSSGVDWLLEKWEDLDLD